MARQLDQILVVDVEATCWEGRNAPEGQISEIIETGLAMVDLKSGIPRITEFHSLLIKPMESEISPYCTQLTTLTANDLKDAMSFEEACEELVKGQKSRNRTWASYGVYDRFHFEIQCRRRNVPYPFNAAHINIKNLFAIKKRLKREIGLKRALNHLGLKQLGTSHRGVDDAVNAARVLIETIK